jgi:hypothetical protein
VSLEPVIDNNVAFLICRYTTGDAAGQNMVTIATNALCEDIAARCSGADPKTWYIEGNFSGDKKASSLGLVTGRGRKVSASVTCRRRSCEKTLGTTVQAMLDYGQVANLGAHLSGQLGAQAHFANGLAALYIATGQDAACVAESAMGITRMERRGEDLFCSVTMPNILVGSVGGGTGLPSQAAGLNILGLKGAGKGAALAEVAAATCLCGEISIVAAIAAGHFTRAHETWRGTDDAVGALDLPEGAVPARQDRAAARGVLGGEHLRLGGTGGKPPARPRRVRGGLRHRHGAVFPDAGLRRVQGPRRRSPLPPRPPDPARPRLAAPDRVAGPSTVPVTVLAAWLWHPPVLWLLALVWAWLLAMSFEFGVPEWLKARPVVYLLSHMAIMPLIDLLLTGLEWVPGGGAAPGLGLFLALSFVNGCVLEIGRKLWAPENEIAGVDSYSRPLGAAPGGDDLGRGHGPVVLRPAAGPRARDGHVRRRR